MAITKLKFKRSFSNGNANIVNALTAGNMTLVYGEPVWFKNNFYGSAKMFVGDDSGDPLFIGPYIAGDGIIIDNTATSATVGQIAMQYPIPSLTGNSGKLLAANSDGTALTLVSQQTMRTMNGEQLTDSSLGDINIHDGFYFPNAVQDYDGNWYGAVVIGNQVWLGENLRTTHYANGDAIRKTILGSVTYRYEDYSNSQVQLKKRGYFYPWSTVMHGQSSSSANPSNIQGIAPDGWHVPSKAEYKQFTDYMDNQKRYYINSNYAVGKAISSSSYWNTASMPGSPGYNKETNNAAVFGIYPVSYSQASSGIPYTYMTGREARFWTTTQADNNNAYSYYLYYNAPQFVADYKSKGVVANVRCVSNLTPLQFRDWYINQYGSMQHHLPQEIPTNVSSFTNDAGYLTESTLPSDILWVTFSKVEHSDGTMTCDKTYAEITAAMAAGRAVIAMYQPAVNDYPKQYFTLPTNSDSNTLLFANMTPNSANEVLIISMTSSACSLDISKDYSIPDVANNDGKVLYANSLGDAVYWGNLPTIPTVPTAVSSFTNDAGYITASDVPQEVLMCTYSSLSNTVDKTPQEIYEAKVAGNAVLLYYGSSIAQLTLAQQVNDTYIITFDGIVDANVQTPQINNISYINGTWHISTDNLQKQLISGTNIKTINNQSILDSGNISLPTNVSDLTNDAGYITADDVPENVSSFNNDSGYINQIKTINGISMTGTGDVVLPTTLSRQDDVVLNSQTDEQVLAYDGTASKWKNKDLKTVNGTSLIGSGNILIDQDFETVTELTVDASMSDIFDGVTCNNANVLLQIKYDRILTMDEWAQHENYFVVNNTSSVPHTITFDYSGQGISAFIGSGEYVVGNNALQVTVPALSFVMVSMRVINDSAVLFSVDRVRLHNTPVTEAELADDDVAIVLKHNTTGDIRYMTIEDIQTYSPDLSSYTVKPFVRFTRGRNGRSVVIHKDNISSTQWAINNYYKLYCDTTIAGSFTMTIGNWGRSDSWTVSWAAGDTLDSIKAQLTNASYVWFTKESGEDFIRISCYCSSTSYTCTLTNNIGGSVDDLSKYCRVNGVVQSEVHRVWQGTNVRTLFPNSGFLPTNTAQYAKNGYNMSYMCGANLARYKAYYRTNGASSYVAESSVAARMTETAFAALNNSGVTEQQALYDKYNGSWDAYMDASMIQIDDMHTNGIEYQSYDNGDTQSQFLASVETKNFVGDWVHVYPSAYKCAQKTDIDFGIFNLPTNHEIAVFMEDNKMSKINTALNYISGTVLSNTSYYWSVAHYNSSGAWLCSGTYGILNTNHKYYTYSVRALAYLN